MFLYKVFLFYSYFDSYDIFPLCCCVDCKYILC